MKKHDVIINMTNNSLVFWPGYCTQTGAIFLTILSQPESLTQITAVKIEKFVTPQKMIKRGSKEDVTYFMQTLNKWFGKKRRHINKSKQKAKWEEISSRKAIIIRLNNFDKKELPVSIPVTIKSKLNAKNINTAIINPDVYCAACWLKDVQLFVVSIRDIQYQAEKETRVKIDPKNVVSQEYKNFLDIFSKKKSDTFLLYQKYDYKI